MIEDTPKKDFVRIGWHLSDPYTIPMGDTRASYYGVTGIPYVVFDGVLKGYDPFEDELNTRLKVSSPLSTNFTAVFDEIEISYDLALKVKETISGNDIKVLFVLLEDGVLYSGSTFNGVARWAGNEKSLSIRNIGENETFSGKITIDPAWNPKNLFLTAFIQNRTTHDVLQSAIAFRPNLDWKSTIMTAEADSDRVIPLTLKNDMGMNLTYKLVLDSKSLPPGWTGTFCFKGLCSFDSAEVAVDADSSLGIDVHFYCANKDNPEALMTFTAAFQNNRKAFKNVTLLGRAGKVELENDGYLVDDDMQGGSYGNGDGKIQPGEMVDLATTAYNSGKIKAFEVTSTLSCSNNKVSILKKDEDFGDIAAGAKVQGGGPRIVFYPEIAPGYIDFIQTFKDLEGHVVKDTFKVLVEGLSVGDDNGRVLQFRTSLGENYPNPFNPVTTIPFMLDKKSSVTLSVFTVEGTLVREFNPGELSPGVHSIIWDGTNQFGARVSSGIYIYRLVTESGSFSRRMVLVK